LNDLSAMTAFTALSCRQDVWLPLFISGLTSVFPKHIPEFAIGARSTGTCLQVFRGRYMDIGTRVGMPIHQRYAPMFSICSKTQPPNQFLEPSAVNAVDSATRSTSQIGVGSLHGRYNSFASGEGSTAIGYRTYARGEVSTAMGENAQAVHDNSFVWSDGTYWGSTAANQFVVYATGGLQLFGGGLAISGASSPNYAGAQGVFIESQGTYGSVFAFDYVDGHTLPLRLNAPGGNVGVGTVAPTHLFQVGNAYCDGNTWAPSSDRNLKGGFQPLDAQKVLARVAALPITSWHYTNDVATSHVGPMAQDFYAAFNVGADDKHITTTDESGVALVAIQGLNEKMESDAQAKDARITTLEHELSELKKLLAKLAAGKSEP